MELFFPCHHFVSLPFSLHIPPSTTSNSAPYKKTPKLLYFCRCSLLDASCCFPHFQTKPYSSTLGLLAPSLHTPEVWLWSESKLFPVIFLPYSFDVYISLFTCSKLSVHWHRLLGQEGAPTNVYSQKRKTVCASHKLRRNLSVWGEINCKFVKKVGKNHNFLVVSVFIFEKVCAKLRVEK